MSIILEPRWKSLIVETTTPLFTPEQCQLIINAGRSEPQEMGQVGGGAQGTVDTKTRTSHISWIPFSKMPEMYATLERVIKQKIRLAKIAYWKKIKIDLASKSL